MKVLLVLIVVSQLSGCAGYNHYKLRQHQDQQAAELGLDSEYGVSNRNSSVQDAANGALWWIGSDIVKETLNNL